MQRVCFQLQVRPDRLEEYTRRHAAVWTDMLHALGDSGWHNYSLFLRPDGLLIGYVETPTSPQPTTAWPAPRSTPAGRPRWPSSSSSSTTHDPTKVSRCSPRSSTSRTSSPEPPDQYERREMTTVRRSPQLAALAIEVPSWAYGNSGTRFKVFGTPGTPRTVQEKIADAAKVHRFTGLAPTVALHIPWDLVDDYGGAARLRRGPRRAARHDQLQHLPGRRLQARQPDPRRRDGPRRRRSTTTSSASRSWTRPARAT